MRVLTCSSVLLVASAGCLNAQTVETIASGLQLPERLAFTPTGNLLVSEGGTPEPNTGRISIVDRSGNRRTLLEGLPSGLAHFTYPFGPTGMALDDRILYLLIGEGDVMAGMPPNYGINLNGPSSPIFSSLLKIEFSREPGEIQSSFRLESVHHWALLDGDAVNLTNASGDRATLTLLTAFRPLVRNVLGGSHAVRPSDPNSVVLDPSKRFLYVADASAETITRVDITTGRYLTLYRFVPVMRDTPAGRVPVDQVPTSLCWWGDRLLVGNLTASPFPRGEAMVRSFDPQTRSLQTMADGFSAITDLACSRSATGGLTLVISELTNDLSSPMATGRVVLYENGAPRVIASGLAATAVAIHPMTGDIYMTSLGGRLARAPMR